LRIYWVREVAAVVEALDVIENFNRLRVCSCFKAARIIVTSVHEAARTIRREMAFCLVGGFHMEAVSAAEAVSATL
jgi:hypothetical protein